MMNPSSRISDIEKTEMYLPFLSLGRRNAVDSGGYGKYRGGMAPQNIYMIYGTDQFAAGLIGSGRRTPANFGMFGGYPGAVHESRYCLDSELRKWFESSVIPGTFEEIAELRGRVIDPPSSFGPIPVKQYDILVIRQGAGGGYGDPLDRDPERVANDVRNFSVTLETARKAYGVVLDPKSLEVDRSLTEKAREEIRNERLRNGKPVNVRDVGNC
jgi:N-methylhydantoinase B